MSTALARPISFNEIALSEQEQDPNSALLELDRGLKSTNVGEQCEAISKCPRLFEKYPFPILINSAMLKLAEVFRQEVGGSNFVRVCVCEVLESCGRHLDKLINVDEFLRRITTVMHSNDPMARALTLRALGLLCGVVGEAKQVQHLVRDALDASHSLELQAAIAAAEKYAAVSKTFAVSMCERLTQMLSALSTPVEVKLQLIKVFQHMHHDAETASTVRGVCLQLLERYPTQRVVITTLHALTQLAAHCLVHIPDQVDLVLSWVSQECRAGVRGAALQELQYLASSAPHAWSPGNVSSLVAFTRSVRAGKSSSGAPAGSAGGGATGMAGLNLSSTNTSGVSEQDRTTTAALDVLATLTSAPALPQLDITHDCEIVKLSREFVYDANTEIATMALQLYTNVALYMHEECSSQSTADISNSDSNGDSGGAKSSVLVCSDTLNAGISLLHTLAQRSANNNSGVSATNVGTKHQAFKIPLVSCVLLARCDQSLAASLASTLVTLLTDDSLPGGRSEISVVVCEALASLGGSRRGVLSPHIPPLIGLLHSITKPATAKKNTKLISVVCSVLMQAYLGHSWDSVGVDSVITAAQRTDNWTAYRLARQASRYGHHQVAATIFSSIRNRVCTDQQHYWLTALQQVSSGEAWTCQPIECSDEVTTDVVDDRAKPLTAATTCLYSALANFKACSSVQHTLVFVQQYCSIRAAALACHSQLITTCQSMRTSPPPAIAASQVAALRDEMVRCCRLVQQFNKLAKDFTAVAQQYATLYQSQFDADPQTLSNISSLQQGAKLMARAIGVLTRPMADHQYQSGSKTSGVEGGIPQPPSGASVQEQLMHKALARADSTIVQLEKLCVEKKPIVECQLQLLTGISEMITGVPLPYPRLFYQSLQHTTLTLNITPQPRTPGDPITIQNSSQLAVKVEGVIGHGCRPGLFRSVKSVTLLVNSTIQNRPQHTLDMKVEPNETLTQTVDPHNDFFSAQFLLAFPIPGQYQVTIDTSVTDESDETWQTGPRHSLSVKALEDPTNVKPLQPPPPPSQPLAGPSTARLPPPPPPGSSASAAAPSPLQQSLPSSSQGLPIASSQMMPQQLPQSTQSLMPPTVLSSQPPTIQQQSLPSNMQSQLVAPSPQTAMSSQQAQMMQYQPPINVPQPPVLSMQYQPPQQQNMGMIQGYQRPPL